MVMVFKKEYERAIFPLLAFDIRCSSECHFAAIRNKTITG